jgi:multidrug efflux pump subunit AcrA (membrane-fusion protein)
VNRGDHVTAGQLVAELENRDLAAAVADARAQYDQAQAIFRTTTAATMPEDLTKAQADVQSATQSLDAAKRVYESRQQLLAEGAIARKLVDDAKVALVQAQSQFETAQRHLQSLQTVGRTEQVRSGQAQVDSAQARYQSAQAQLSYSEIHSPISGVVSDRPVYPGEIAAAGAPLLSVVDISQVVARANVPVEQAAFMKIGQPAAISAADVELMGKVTVVSPAVNPNTTTVEIWVQASNPGERLKPGVTVHVAVHTQTIRDALLVPAAALLSSDEGGQKVIVIGKDSKAYERSVEVGVRNADQVQVTKGVNAGEQVVTVGGLGLEDKAQVTVITGKEADDEKSDDKEKADKHEKGGKNDK